MAIEAMVTKLVLEGGAAFSGGIDRAAQSVDRYDKQVGKAHGSTVNLGGAIAKGAQLAVQATAALAGLAIGGAAFATREFVKYDAAIRKAAATGKETAGGMLKLSDQALAMGKNVRGGPTAVAEGLWYIESAGIKSADALKALPPLIDLASAGNIKLEDSASMVLTTINSFGYGIDQIPRVADVLAEGAAQSMTNISELGMAMSYAAPTAKALGWSLEQLTAVEMKLADAGYRGERGGTAFRSAMASMLNPSNDVAGIMKRIGLSAADLKNPEEMFRKLAAANLSAADASKLFTLEGAGMKAATDIIGGGLSKIVTGLNVQGTAAAAAKMQNQGLGATFEYVWAKVSALGIEIGEKLEPSIRAVGVAVNIVTNLLTNMVGAGGAADGIKTAEERTRLWEEAMKRAEETGKRWALVLVDVGEAGARTIGNLLVGMADMILLAYKVIPPLTAIAALLAGIGAVIAFRAGQIQAGLTLLVWAGKLAAVAGTMAVTLPAAAEAASSAKKTGRGLLGMSEPGPTGESPWDAMRRKMREAASAGVSVPGERAANEATNPGGADDAAKKAAVTAKAMLTVQSEMLGLEKERIKLLRGELHREVLGGSISALAAASMARMGARHFSGSGIGRANGAGVQYFTINVTSGGDSQQIARDIRTALQGAG